MRLPHVTTLCVALLTVSAGAVVGQDDPDTADLRSEVARLDTMTAERDALLAKAEAAAARYDKSTVTQELLYDIIADPAAYGTEREVLDVLDGLAAPGTVYGDDAFGSTSWRGVAQTRCSGTSTPPSTRGCPGSPRTARSAVRCGPGPDRHSTASG